MIDNENTPIQIIECQHPEDKREVETLGYMDFYAGDIADSIHQVVICKECGAVLHPDPEVDEGILF